MTKTVEFGVELGIKISQLLGIVAGLKAGYLQGVDDTTKAVLEWLAENKDSKLL